MGDMERGLRSFVPDQHTSRGAAIDCFTNGDRLIACCRQGPTMVLRPDAAGSCGRVRLVVMKKHKLQGAVGAMHNLVLTDIRNGSSLSARSRIGSPSRHRQPASSSVSERSRSTRSACLSRRPLTAEFRLEFWTELAPGALAVSQYAPRAVRGWYGACWQIASVRACDHVALDGCDIAVVLRRLHSSQRICGSSIWFSLSSRFLRAGHLRSATRLSSSGSSNASSVRRWDWH